MRKVMLDPGHEIMTRLRGVIDDPCHCDTLYAPLAQLGGRKFTPKEFEADVWVVLSTHLKGSNPKVPEEAMAVFMVIVNLSKIVRAVSGDSDLHAAAMSRMPKESHSSIWYILTNTDKPFKLTGLVHLV
ncbi:MAG: hypothetical protein PVI21_01810 [Candidatus Woesebacteria bacterium]|jgi:hypothetical protein